MADKNIDETTGIETTGHSWDGIQELNNPLPRWWLWTLYATIVWGVGYTIAYPAWPLLTSATSGYLGYSTRAEVAQDIANHEARNSVLVSQLLNADLDAMPPNSDLHRYAVSRGGAVFRAQCIQCHGAGAGGAKGYPNLLDNDWLWGGTLADITYTVRHGIRNNTDPDARYSEMPAYAEILDETEISSVVEYVVRFSSADVDETLAAAGQPIFDDNCSACHGENARGDRDLGAPNLADAIWLYGGDREAITVSVKNARFGAMPAWGQRLNEQDVRAVSVFIHALGGGE